MRRVLGSLQFSSKQFMYGASWIPIERLRLACPFFLGWSQKLCNLLPGIRQQGSRKAQGDPTPKLALRFSVPRCKFPGVAGISSMGGAA